jgi:hypothetical protein
VEQSGGQVKALSLSGTAPTEENVKSGRLYKSSTWVTPEFKDIGYSFKVK